MWTSIFLLCTTAVAIVSSTNWCSVDFHYNCRGTVTCEMNNESDFVNGFCDAQSLPRCPFMWTLNFVIRDSVKTSLDTGYLDATGHTCHSYVKRFTATGVSWSNLGRNAFQYFANCVDLDLSNNKIVTIDGGAFMQLGSLQHLNLSRNSIEHLESDFLYCSENYNTELQVIDLSYNKITELLSPVFKYAPKLTFVSNKLLTLHQNVFAGLSDLNELYLNNNKLISFSFNLDYAKSLRTLDVSCNMLTVVLRDEMSKLLSLKYLNMSHNRIELVDVSSFSQAHYLEVIDLSNNRFISSVENSLFSVNHELKWLDLSNNSIKKIKGRSFLNNRLEYINLKGNVLSGDLRNDTLVGLNLITTLNLSNQNITGIRANAFQDMSKLEMISLGANNITTVELNSFKNASALQSLDMSFNKISDLLFLNNSLNNLTHLDLKHNLLTVIKGKSFVAQTKLIKLDLSHNEIYFIEQNALPLNKLEYLFLFRNTLNGTVQKYTFSPAKFLKCLDLSNGSIKRIEDESFTDMPVLTRLDLSMNKIHYLGSNNFNGMNNISSLNISFNRLSQFILNDLNMSDHSTKIFEGSSKIQVLLSSNNNISKLNFNESNTLTHLTKLDLSNNIIDEINLNNLEKFEYINLSCNRLKYISHDFLKNLGKLLLLDISNNQMNDVAPGTFKNMESLRILNLSRNSLTELRYGVFYGLVNVDILDLSNNHLSDIEINIFHELPTLHSLILDYNNLSHIDFITLANIAPELKKLSLGGNRIRCKDIVALKYIDGTVMRPIKITSIDNIYHEENVNGMTCKHDKNTDEDVVNKSTIVLSSSIVLGLVVTCCLSLTISIIVVCLSRRYYFSKRAENNCEPYKDIRLNFRQQHD